MSTPLQDLDDAIHAFLATTGREGQALHGWVLGISTSRIEYENDDTIPLISGQRYALGPQTHVTDALGLARYLQATIESQMIYANEADDD